ncbi:conserved hypothetical protein [Paraburkholderia ribeironis]|uniref:Lipoprotein n=1 Tax=Paraburkholderia ribeironis TaxID=1247936 RepID=A0A1N7RKX4_9BURK|nr:hypothetical protein [Paraburkholderia ribeironis]SIT35760.1 conserved hypothetical protein [Paraburkholderia ribeironis]
MTQSTRRQSHAGERGTFKGFLLVGVCACLLTLTGCPYYGPYYAAPPGTVVTAPASFNRSFSAAAGAMRDEGLALNVQDPGSGNIVGELNGSVVTATVRQQADGSVVVQFNSSNTRDPTLLDRISRSYDRRMGR